ncbi:MULTISPECIES: UPF0182 family protein [unclassified Cyanobium]|uniref:UPF0182 family protein n=1 Tax=unclassified Cyanobium TaxID=2627006 RepID=UPI0020CF3B10|nr:MULTISPECIES: UPF0182 family protein [unclassified Cyanobium]MCP9833319.1 UPF0182 family protein [Cyanobium sp. La Preciosa 7G6]MCP9935818.1 UPF0182 family protein [Cyanobium sp. Aljojuca 7A6]
MPDPSFLPARLRPRLAVGLAIAFGLLVALWAAARLSIEWLWFAQFDFQGILVRRWMLQISAFILVFGLGLVLQLAQLQRCWRLREQGAEAPRPSEPLLRLGNGALVVVLIGLVLLLAGGLSYLMVQARGLIENPFNGDVITGFSVLRDLPPLLVAGLAGGLLLPLLLWPHTTLRITLAASLAGSATAVARGWSLWLPALLATPFGEGDPLTGFDLSFTVLRLPALRLVLSVILAQGLVGLAACLLLTIGKGRSLTDLHFDGLSKAQQRVLQPQVAALAVVMALSNALAPFDLMVQGSGVASGAGYVDLHVRLPLRLLFAVLLLLTAFALLVPLPRGWFRRGALLPLAGTALLVPISEWVLAPLAQRLWVQPRELAVEAPYLERSIQATRRAFGLEHVRTIRLEPRQGLTKADLASAPGTLDNIRLWDSQPLLAANRQLQQLRLYYTFPSADVDRYPLQGKSARDGSQQVLISARELDSSALPPGSRTWLNRHLVFTNGHGFTVSPVNAFGADGLPLFFVKDLGSSGRVQGLPELGVTDQEAQAALPVGSPSLYFASGPSPYAIAPTKVKEFSYPEGELNVYTHYNGTIGISLAHPLQRLAAAVYLREPRLLFTGSFTERSLLLLRRQVNQRLTALAPFLRFESQPYLVTARVAGSKGYRPEQYQYWLLDGFTTSRSYPYSDPNPQGLRYFRNPVKAVVDAHDGRLWFYVNDARDPVLRTWIRAFPELFRPLSAMPPALLAHIRVPKSQFDIQSERLLRYHVTDVRTFYNGDDVWSVPSEIYGENNVPVSPYHLTLQLPGEDRSEFVLLLPFTPLKRSNLVGWLAARNDPPHYGELLLVRFPQQRLLLGPQQITALIDQDPTISFQFGLWNRLGSRLFRGNLLVLPVGEGLLYVEPIYLQSKSNDLPTLVRVVVTDGRRFVMERSLRRALERLVEEEPGGKEAGSPRPPLPLPAGTPLPLPLPLP